MSATLVMHDEEFRMIHSVAERLCREANARTVFVIDKNGQVMAQSGEVDSFDTTSLASLVAGEMAATGGLAKLIGEKDFAVLFHEGVQDSLLIALVASKLIVVVVFDKRTNVGMVRLRLKKSADELARIFERLVQRSQMPGSTAPFAEITDDDIDNLFVD